MAARILVTGASVAGNTAAWWLTKHGFKVEVVERAPEFRGGGQNVDVRGNAREVLRRMGLEEQAFALRTVEEGTAWVTEDDSEVARFEAGDEEGDSGPTAELEILRGDIARLIYDAVCERAAFRFGDRVNGLEQDASGVDVTFESGRQARYDLVVVAEGVGSATRELVFPGENTPRWMDITIAYFSIPGQPGDSDYARQYNTTGGRGATLKPGRNGRLGAYLGVQKKPEGENEWSEEEQRRFIHALFADEGWEFPRILAAMRDVDDFYFDVLRQVHMPRWSNGRVVLTGDAAWCPTPLSGIGTTLAMVGSYVLAGEVSKGGDPAAALARYERMLRPFVDEGQGLPKIVPRLLWPYSKAGLTILRAVLRVAGTSLGQKIVSKGFARDSNSIDLPDY
ncbi:FAD-dependent monooxygenase [uncultured Massilia sp.]|uniref:FAD-dependent monooxygenase n=1 Tax=uncultured Massilia sp. TaxID=169973 RepID=UPI00258A8EA3|nr:FAD-dependent monooxygenase [uncultured Massilia sp.]